MELFIHNIYTIMWIPSMSLVRMLSTRPSTKMSALLTDSADILVHTHSTNNGYYYYYIFFVSFSSTDTTEALSTTHSEGAWCNVCIDIAWCNVCIDYCGCTVLV